MMTQLVVLALLLAIGLVFGMIAERRHYRDILERELRLNGLPAVATRFPPPNVQYQQVLVIGSVVIGSDYFKTFSAWLVNLLGGRVRTFESLIDRGRRESMLRMKSQAESFGAEHVFNVKYVTASIGAANLPAIEVLCFGTALIPPKTSAFGNGLSKPTT